MVQVPHIESEQLSSSYKFATRTWRHSFHSICSRVACFPPTLAHYFIQSYTKPGDRVLDIFSGTGTAPLQACLDGRVGIGNDLSPEAYVLTSAKVNAPKSRDFCDYLREVSRRLRSASNPKIDDDLYFGSDFLREKLNPSVFYHRDTLVEIVKLRNLLLHDLSSRSESRVQNGMFCAALTLGILHGDRPESLSLPLDRSKSLTPNHLVKMRQAFPGKYEIVFKDLMRCLSLKAEKAYKHVPPRRHGYASQEDAKLFKVNKPVKLVITSPPYFAAHTYAYDNRHRLWFLGHDYREVNERMFQTPSKTQYLAYVLQCLKGIEEMLEDDSACVLVVGDVEMVSKNEKIIVKTGDEVAHAWADLRNTEMEVARIIVDPIPLKSRRYIHVPITQGIKVERIVIFHKGSPAFTEPWIDWTVRPRLENGPNWSSIPSSKD